ncbi:MAG: LPXTG cell wall anchor domain-containing protein [Candidatus Moranbacteria bacterium]|nr:LPXTG cell wall anchor domain-containing protein [Candidatus Moranbacteria bacterium]
MSKKTLIFVAVLAVLAMTFAVNFVSADNIEIDLDNTSTNTNTNTATGGSASSTAIATGGNATASVGDISVDGGSSSATVGAVSASSTGGSSFTSTASTGGSSSSNTNSRINTEVEIVREDTNHDGKIDHRDKKVRRVVYKKRLPATGSDSLVLASIAGLALFATVVGVKKFATRTK